MISNQIGYLMQSALRTWREGKGRDRKGLADEIEVTPVALGRYERHPSDPGQQIPARAVMIRLYRVTAGRVTPNDFYDLPDLDAEAARRPAAA